MGDRSSLSNPFALETSKPPRQDSRSPSSNERGPDVSKPWRRRLLETGGKDARSPASHDWGTEPLFLRRKNDSRSSSECSVCGLGSTAVRGRSTPCAVALGGAPHGRDRARRRDRADGPPYGPPTPRDETPRPIGLPLRRRDARSHCPRSPGPAVSEILSAPPRPLTARFHSHPPQGPDDAVARAQRPTARGFPTRGCSSWRVRRWSGVSGGRLTNSHISHSRL